MKTPRSLAMAATLVLGPMIGLGTDAYAQGQAMSSEAMSSEARARLAQRHFDALYGGDLQRVLSTPGAFDDVRLAEQLIEAAEKAVTNGQQELAGLMCEKAYDLSEQHHHGIEQAIEAVKLWGQLNPDRRLLYFQRLYPLQLQSFRGRPLNDRQQVGEQVLQTSLKLGELYQQQEDYQQALRIYRQAQSIARRIDSDLHQEVRQHMQVASFRSEQSRRLHSVILNRLERDPQNEDLHREAFLTYLLYLNQPKKAKQYAQLGATEQDKRMLELVHRPMRQLSPDQHHTLAEWYRRYTAEAPSQGRYGLGLRALTHYKWFLAAQEHSDRNPGFAELAMLKLIQEEPALEDVAESIEVPDTYPLEMPWLTNQWSGASQSGEAADGGQVRQAQPDRSGQANTDATDEQQRPNEDRPARNGSAVSEPADQSAPPAGQQPEEEPWQMEQPKKPTLPGLMMHITFDRVFQGELLGSSPEPLVGQIEAGADLDRREKPTLQFPNKQSLKLDGQSQYVKVPDGPDINGTGTLSLWFSSQSLGPRGDIQVLFSYARDTGRSKLRVGIEGRRIYAMIGDSEVIDTAQAVRQGAWQHVVVTWSRGFHRVFVNGMTAAEGWHTPFRQVNNDYFIGRYGGTPPYYFQGLVDEVRLYNRALSEEEVWHLTAGMR